MPILEKAEKMKTKPNSHSAQVQYGIGLRIFYFMCYIYFFTIRPIMCKLQRRKSEIYKRTLRHRASNWQA